MTREEAIESLERVRELSGLKRCRESLAIDMAIEALSQPERPKGRWEKSICTNCGKDVYEGLDADIWSAYIPPFCPNCGADMRGEEE